MSQIQLNDRIETLILQQLFDNEEYTRKVLPFIKEEYFLDETERILFSKASSFIQKYNTLPTRDAIAIVLGSDNSLRQDIIDKTSEYLSEDLSTPATEETPTQNPEWLLDTTESWCKEKALYNAALATIKIIEDKTSKQEKGVIPGLFEDALAVSFDPHVGHDYLNDWEERYEFYHRKEEQIACDIDLLNQIMNGGAAKKTLNILMGGTNVGKSICLCHLAAAYMSLGHNVLYITLELSEERVSQRIDANLLNVKMNELINLPKAVMGKRIADIRAKTVGALKVKEYPTAGAHVGHFRHAMHELKLKNNFVPTIIMVDYVNICLSSRIRMGGSVNTNTYIKSVAEELRGFAKEFNAIVWTVTQLNREGYDSTNPGMTDVAESFGLSQTADIILGLVQTEEMEAINQILFKQIKNRDNDKSSVRRFLVGLDKPKMRLFNLEDSAQQTLCDSNGTGKSKKKQETEDDTPAFDKGKFGQGLKSERNGSRRPGGKSRFGDFEI